ncbi:hypothetical protein C8R45DRAFT_1222671 [Mycena sanguinolenta]|nr:hypothetical protein C8R45DRAFT_1222671 [Mycena sanguinolenta]
MKRIIKLLGKSKPRASSVLPSGRVPDPSAPSLTMLTRPASPQTAPAPLPRESLSSAGQTAWTNLKEVLKALRNGSDLYPPLKVALSGVTSVMTSIDHVGDVNKEFLGISENIKGFQGIFAQYIGGKEITPAMRPSLDAMTLLFIAVLLLYHPLNLISRELKLIEEAISSESLTPHRPTRHIVEPGDVEEIMIAFQRFSKIIDKLQSEIDLHSPDYHFNVFGGIGGAGGMSEQGTGGNGGIGQGPILHITNSTVNTISKDVLAKLSCIDSASIDAQHPEGCLKGTRVKLLADLQAWSQDPHGPRIFWLDGMAGTGKSAIARSFCRMLQKANQLGGSFFCMRGNADRSSPKCIIPTLATQLLSRDRAYKSALLAAIEGISPDVNVQIQVETLLENPLRNAHSNNHPTLVLVIDALDGLNDEGTTRDLVRRLVSVVHGLAIKLFVTSRPERHIRPHFGTDADH